MSIGDSDSELTWSYDEEAYRGFSYNMQVKQVPAHSKILPAEIWQVDGLKTLNLWQ